MKERIEQAARALPQRERSASDMVTDLWPAIEKALAEERAAGREEQFVRLEREHATSLRWAIGEEREACAKLAEGRSARSQRDVDEAGGMIAEAIRSRGEPDDRPLRARIEQAQGLFGAAVQKLTAAASRILVVPGMPPAGPPPGRPM